MPGTRPRTIAVLCAGLALASCTSERRVAVIVDASATPGVARWALRVDRGACPAEAALLSGELPEPVHQQRFSRDEPAVAIGVLRGAHAVSVVGTGADCAVIAHGCAELADSATLTIRTQAPSAAGGGCAPGETCAAGRCVDGVDDAGLDDAAVDDAGLDDAAVDDAAVDDAGLDDAAVDDAAVDDAGLDGGAPSALCTSDLDCGPPGVAACSLEGRCSTVAPMIVPAVTVDTGGVDLADVLAMSAYRVADGPWAALLFAERDGGQLRVRTIGLTGLPSQPDAAFPEREVVGGEALDGATAVASTTIMHPWGEDVVLAVAHASSGGPRVLSGTLLGPVWPRSEAAAPDTPVWLALERSSDAESAALGWRTPDARLATATADGSETPSRTADPFSGGEISVASSERPWFVIGRGADLAFARARPSISVRPARRRTDGDGPPSLAWIGPRAGLGESDRGVLAYADGARIRLRRVACDATDCTLERELSSPADRTIARAAEVRDLEIVALPAGGVALAWHEGNEVFVELLSGETLASAVSALRVAVAAGPRIRALRASALGFRLPTMGPVARPETPARDEDRLVIAMLSGPETGAAGSLEIAQVRWDVPTCTLDVGNGSFQRGTLEGYCLEGESVGDPRALVRVESSRAIVDLTSSAAPARVRLYDERELEESENVVFRDVTGSGDVLLGIELVGWDGAVLGRVGRCPAVGCTCGAGVAACVSFPLGGNVEMSPLDALTRLPIDPRLVARVRRFVEVGAGSRVEIDAFTTSPRICPLAWWRQSAAPASLVLEERFDTLRRLDWSEIGGDGELRMALGTCGGALSLAGVPIDRRPAGGLDLSEPLTLELWWSVASTAGARRAGVLLEALGGAFALEVGSGSTLRARAGSCGAGPALEVVDAAPLDVALREVELLVDWAGGELCLFRSGRLVGCDSTPACALGPAPASEGLRLGGGLAPGSSFGGVVDELRVHRGDVAPLRGAAASGSCFPDRVCALSGRPGFRDAASYACVDTAERTRVSRCREHALDDAATCPLPSGTRACAPELAPTCFAGVRDCTGTCAGLDQCTDAMTCE